MKNTRIHMYAINEHELTLAILKHLASNPKGMDTLEGIARFWILKQRIEVNVKEVEVAVNSLIKRGLLVKRDPRGEINERCYSLNPSKASEINELMGDTDH
jgi:hypothetical protein